MADVWAPSAFGLTPAASAAVPAPVLNPADSSAWEPSLFGLTPAPPQPRATPQAAAQSTRTGILPNAAAAVAEGSADTLNALSDPFGNLIGKPIAALGTTVHDALAPVFGYQKFTPEDRAALLSDDVPQIGTRIVGAVGDAIGAPSLDAVQPGSLGEQLLRSGVRAGVGMMGLGAGAGSTLPGLVRAGAAGAAGGVAGDVASMVAPDEYKPAASLLGNVLGAGVLAAGATAGVHALSDLTAPMFGRRNALMDVAGAPIIGSDGAPVMASTNQVRVAGNQLQAAASDPTAVRTALAAPPASPVADAQPTTAQLTRDPGLAMTEYAASRSGTPQQQAAFRARADAQNDARVGVLRGIGDGADPGAVPTYIQQQAADIGAAGDARVAQAQAQQVAQVQQAQQAGQQVTQAAQARAAQALDGIGGNLPAGSDAQVGQALRQPLAESLAQTRQQESALWNAIDPNKTLAVDMSPVRMQADSIAAGISPNAAPLAGSEAAIMQTARGLPDVQSFSDLAALRQRITDNIRAARSDPSRAQEVMRQTQLLGSVHDAMAGAANSVDLAPAATAAPAASVPAAAPNVGSDVFTPSGQRVPVRYQVADAGDLVTSHGSDMQPNPAFPAELQPRDRDRAASGVQVARIAGQLQPERLGASSTVADGAPIVGPDNVVESGNGRVMALRKAYDANGSQAAAYRTWLDGQGHDTAGLQQPVLIRRRVGDMTPEQRQAFVAEANAPTTLAMSSTERAASDAKRLSEDVLQHYQPGDVTDPGNRAFARSFLRNVVDPGQEGALVTADGSLSQEGAARMRAALVQRAYGDKGLSAALGETTDPTARVLAGAMQDAAGPMAQLRAGIEAGRVDPGMDFAPALVEAAQVVQRARKAGISLADAVGQRDAFGQVSARAEGILKAAYGSELSGQMSRERMGEMLSAFARRAQEQSAEGNLLGANLTADQLLEGVSSRYGKATGTEGANAARVSGGHWQGYGRYGDQARGLTIGPRGQGASEAGGGQQGRGSSRVLEQAPLTPNFDQAAAGRYADARQATADRVATYRNAPGVGRALAQGPTAGSFRASDAAVPNIIVRIGAEGADIARAYLKAGGSPEALTDAAAYSLRQAAMKPDGTLDPGRYQTWARRRAGFLSQVPDAAARFGAAADAQRGAAVVGKAADASLKAATATAQATVNDAMAARAAATRALQTSVLGRFLGDADPVARVGAILRDKPMGRANMAQLAKAVSADPNAVAGLQRAVAEYVQRDLIGNTKGIASAEGYIRNDRFQSFMREAGPALREVMTPEQMKGLQSVADSLEQSNLSAQVGVGSPTAQLTAGRGETLLARIGREIAGGAVGTSAGSGIGYAVAGTVGGYAGGVIGGVVGKAVQSAREAGVQNIEHLKMEALLNPELFKVLMTKVSRQNETGLMNRLSAQFRRISLVGGVQASNQEPDRRKAPATPVNALARPMASTPAPVNALLR